MQACLHHLATHPGQLYHHVGKTLIAQDEENGRCGLPSDFEMPVDRQGWDERELSKMIVFQRQRIGAGAFLALLVLLVQMDEH